ncbi:hypothetical protein ACFL3Y_01780 [Pseudomonadota bacterium]
MAREFALLVGDSLGAVQELDNWGPLFAHGTYKGDCSPAFDCDGVSTWFYSFEYDNVGTYSTLQRRRNSYAVAVKVQGSTPTPTPTPNPTPTPTPTPLIPETSAELYLINRPGDVSIIDTSEMKTRYLGDIASVGPDIALDKSGTLLYQATKSTQMLNGYSTKDFSLISSVPLSGFPSGDNSAHDTLSSLEFAGDILYGSTAAAHFGVTGSGSSVLAKIDIGTGKLSPIGFSGLSAWTTGMAYDPTKGVMYGVTGGYSPSQLFKINLATGRASNIKPITYGFTPARRTFS